MVFVRAEDIGLKGTETPDEINKNKKMLDTLEEIRGKAAEIMGLVDKWSSAVKETPAFPMVAFVAPASDYKDFITGKTISEWDVDFVSRLMFMQVMHKTYAGTGTICTGAAARIKGSVVNRAMAEKGKGQNPIIRIGHPAGIIEIDVAAEMTEGGWVLKKAAISRTARRIMDGFCYIPIEE
jgi:hypothetical protein